MSSSKSKSLLWSHFTPVNEDKKVTCLYCDQQLSVANKSTCSLIRHITKKHPNIFHESKKKHSLAYNNLIEMKQAQNQDESFDDKEEVIYFVADDTKSPDPLKTKRGLYQDGVGTRERKLIEQFTEEKIALTNIQKEVMEKELEEKTIKVLLLQEEMEHRKHMYELEKQEMERKKQIQEMTKEEMFLKIALLKINLSKENTECTEPDMPTIEIVSTE